MTEHRAEERRKYVKFSCLQSWNCQGYFRASPKDAISRSALRARFEAETGAIAALSLGRTRIDSPWESSRRNELDELMSRGQLPSTGNPNSSVIERDRHGKIIRRRFYGADGKAIKNIDYMKRTTAPQAHDWDWTKIPVRQPPRPLMPGE